MVATSSVRSAPRPVVQPPSTSKPTPVTPAPRTAVASSFTATSTPSPKPTAATAREARERVRSDVTVQQRQQQVARTPTTAEVRSLIKTRLAEVPSSAATPAVKQVVQQQLERVDRRLAQGELTPSVALQQTKLWNQHLDQSAHSEIQQKLARSEAIDRMSPLERAHEGLIGIGTGILKTGQAAVDTAHTINGFNPAVALSNVVADTLIGTVRTGDVQKSFGASVEAQKNRTLEALSRTGQAVQAVGQLATDVNTVNPLLLTTGIAGDVVARTITGTDPRAALTQSIDDGWSRARRSAQRLAQLGGDLTGLNKIASGDPRLIGEGVFDLGLLAAPLAKSKAITRTLGVAEELAAAGTSRTLTAAERASLGVADDVAPRVVTVDPPPLTAAQPYRPYAPPTELPQRPLPNGQTVPAPDPLAIAPDGTVHPHTTLGTHTSEAGGYSYVQSSTFPGGRPSVYGTEQIPWGRTDWSSHPSTGTPHPVPHTHPVVMDPTPLGTGGKPGTTLRIPTSGDGHMMPGVAGGNVDFPR